MNNHTDQLRHEDLLQLFTTEYEKYASRMDPEAMDGLWDIAPMVFSKWYYTALTGETILTPANIIHCDEEDPKVEKAYVLHVDKKAAGMEKYSFHPVSYTLENHPILRDMQTILNACLPDCTVDENGFFLPEDREELLKKLTLPDGFYLEYLTRLCQQMGFFQKVPAIHIHKVTKSQKADAFFAKEPKKALDTLLWEGCALAAERLQYTMDLEPGMVSSSFFYQYLENHIDIDQVFVDFYKRVDIDLESIWKTPPNELTEEEQDIMERLQKAFVNCEKLQGHMKVLLSKGSLYKVFNSNLLYHGCVPMDADGNFEQVNVYGKTYCGKKLYDVLETYARKGYYSQDREERRKGRDIIWYIWAGPKSPVFGKDKMATFERYFIEAKETHLEKKNPYYSLLENEKVINQILEEFGLDPAVSHIVNGHVPVKRKDGENPVKCGGKVLVIDGGFSKAYQKETGIAGYTLIFNSYGLLLVAHEPFESTESAIAKEKDIHSETMIVKRVRERLLVGDTDIGEELKRQVKDLERLLVAYRNGELREKR